MTGKELFKTKNIELADGKSYKCEFSFMSLMELEEKKAGEIDKVFEMFEGAMKPSDMRLALWSVLITHHEEFEEYSDNDIKRKISRLIGAEEYMELQFALVEMFGAFWNEAKQSKKLSPEYKKVLDEMENNGKKKK